MAIDKDIKRKVIEDWRNAFPQLAGFTQDKLYKVVGCVIIGLELIKLPRTNEYRPHFVLYPLWKKDVKVSLDFPIILKEFFDKKGLQYSIPYERQSMFFSDVLDSVRKNTLLPFESNIPLKKIVSIIDEYSKIPPLSAAPNSYFQAELQEAKFKIALFVEFTEAQNILEQIRERTWDMNHFKACGVDVSEWLQGLQTSIINRDAFLMQIKTNKQDKKISKLQSSELTT